MDNKKNKIISNKWEELSCYKYDKNNRDNEYYDEEYDSYYNKELEDYENTFSVEDIFYLNYEE